MGAYDRAMRVLDSAAADFEIAAAPAYQGTHSNRGYAPRGTEAVGVCWRCTKHAPVSDVGLCGGCRAWMACETDDDPADEDELSEYEVMIGAGHVPEWMRGAARSLFEAVNGRPIGPPLTESVVLDELRDVRRQMLDEFYERPDR